MSSIEQRAEQFFVKLGKWDFDEHFDGCQCCELMTEFAQAETARKDQVIAELVEAGNKLIRHIEQQFEMTKPIKD